MTEYIKTTIDGCQYYFNNHKLHRTDGPAIINKYSYEYWIDGTLIAISDKNKLTMILEDNIIYMLLN